MLQQLPVIKDSSCGSRLNKTSQYRSVSGIQQFPIMRLFQFWLSLDATAILYISDVKQPVDVKDSLCYLSLHSFTDL